MFQQSPLLKQNIRRVFLTYMRETWLWRRRCWTGSLRWRWRATSSWSPGPCSRPWSRRPSTSLSSSVREDWQITWPVTASYLVSDKQNCRTCDQVISELENIDDECDMYGIQMVKLKDPPLAKRLGRFIVSSCTLPLSLVITEVIKFESKGMGLKPSLHSCISAMEILWHLTVIWSQKNLCWSG